MATIPSNVMRNVRPPVVAFPPSMWGEVFSTFRFDNQVQKEYAEEIENLKRETRSMLMGATSTKMMILVDKLERLGLGYHFKPEIEQKLQQIYEDSREDDQNFTLLVTALRFRILRQHQYHVSSKVFDKFDIGNKEIKETLMSDGEGLLSLYEAAHVRTHDENVLEEAVEFTRHHLSDMLPQLKSPFKDKVQLALKHPLHKSVPLIQTRFYIAIYENDESRDELLLRLAKLNFSFLQNIYRNELSEVLRWWNKFDLKSKLPYARDRMVECYLWGMAHHFEPQYSYVRKAAAIVYELITVMDDTYDNYATIQEAEHFTQALERWNMDHTDLLPEYMKIVYGFIMSVYEDFEREAEKQQKPFLVPYFREAVKQVCRAYNEELKWIMERQLPSFEEYMINSLIRGCLPMILSFLMPGIKSTTKETIDWLLANPKIGTSCSTILRLIGDLASYQRENRDGKLLTILDCYMKDHGVSKHEAFSKFSEIIENEWKKMNTEWVRSSMPKEILEQFLNIGRAAEVTYRGCEDRFTYPEKNMAPLITALLVDSLLI